MKSITGRAQAARDETDKCASAREVGRRHLAHRPDDHGKRHDGDEWDRYKALKPFVAENCPIPMRAWCKFKAKYGKEHDGEKWQHNQSNR